MIVTKRRGATGKYEHGGTTAQAWDPTLAALGRGPPTQECFTPICSRHENSDTRQVRQLHRRHTLCSYACVAQPHGTTLSIIPSFLSGTTRTDVAHAQPQSTCGCRQVRGQPFSFSRGVPGCCREHRLWYACHSLFAFLFLSTACSRWPSQSCRKSCGRRCSTLRLRTLACSKATGAPRPQYLLANDWSKERSAWYSVWYGFLY